MNLRKPFYFLVLVRIITDKIATGKSVYFNYCKTSKIIELFNVFLVDFSPLILSLMLFKQLFLVFWVLPVRLGIWKI